MSVNKRTVTTLTTPIFLSVVSISIQWRYLQLENVQLLANLSGQFVISPFPFIATKALEYSWYLFVESFGSLVVTLFWAFAVDTKEPFSAKRCFPLVVALGQMGGIIFPYSIGGLPHRLGLQTDALSMISLGALIPLIIPLVRYFLSATPKSLLA